MSKLLAPLRVGSNTQAAGVLQRAFGIDVNQMHNPGYARKMNIAMKDAKIALQAAKASVKAMNEIMSIYAEIEKMRHEVIKTGISKDTEIKKLIADIQKAMHKHGLDEKMILQNLNQDMNLMSAEARSASELSQSAYQNKVRLLAANHRYQMGDLRQDLRSSMQEFPRRKQESARFREASSWMYAKDYNPDAKRSGRGVLGFLGFR